MRRGISTYAYTWAIGVPGQMPEKPMSMAELIDLAASHQLECVQIADNLPLTNFSNSQLLDIRAYAQQKGVIIETAAKALTAENMKRYIEIASLLGSDILRFVIDGPDYHPTAGEVIDIINAFTSTLQKKRIVLAIENHDRFKAEIFQHIIETINSPNVRICLDTVNSLGAGESVKEVTDALSRYTVNLHLKEFTIRRVWHKMGFVVEGMPLGEGSLPVENLLSSLGSTCISAILEQWVPPEATLEKTIEKESIWADRSIKQMKKWIQPIT
jgi:Sugar phosphate isomerases/epimerases